MSALGYLVSLGVAFVAGWTLCSYFEAQARVDARRRSRIVERAEREGRRA
ncbi:MAG: hypothetical protein ACKO04_03940 [Actinomycetes bacterium]